MDKLNLIWWFGFRLEQNSTNDPVTLKNIAHFKSSLRWHNHLTTIPRLSLNPGFTRKKMWSYFIIIIDFLNLILICEGGWVRNTTYCTGKDNVCTSPTINVLPEATLESSGVVKTTYQVKLDTFHHTFVIINMENDLILKKKLFALKVKDTDRWLLLWIHSI